MYVFELKKRTKCDPESSHSGKPSSFHLLNVELPES